MSWAASAEAGILFGSPHVPGVHTLLGRRYKYGYLGVAYVGVLRERTSLQDSAALPGVLTNAVTDLATAREQAW
jgi:hypothetical protein